MKKRIDTAITQSMGIMVIAKGIDSPSAIERIAWYALGVGLLILAEIKRN